MGTHTRSNFEHNTMCLQMYVWLRPTSVCVWHSAPLQYPQSHTTHNTQTPPPPHPPPPPFQLQRLWHHCRCFSVLPRLFLSREEVSCEYLGLAGGGGGVQCAPGGMHASSSDIFFKISGPRSQNDNHTRRCQTNVPTAASRNVREDLLIFHPLLHSTPPPLTHKGYLNAF